MFTAFKKSILAAAVLVTGIGAADAFDAKPKVGEYSFGVNVGF